MKTYQVRHCLVCGADINKPHNCSLKNYSKKKYCSAACTYKDPARLEMLKANAIKSANTPNKGRFQKGIKPWNTGKSGYLSKEARQNIGRATSLRVKNEAPEQRKARMAKVLRSRVASGNWKPPRLGKVGAEVTGVWLDNDASYNAKHRWIQNHWTKTGICQQCGRKPRPFGNRRYGTEWANLDKQYDRNDKETWRELCKRCHLALDKPSN